MICVCVWGCGGELRDTIHFIHIILLNCVSTALFLSTNPWSWNAFPHSMSTTCITPMCVLFFLGQDFFLHCKVLRNYINSISLLYSILRGHCFWIATSYVLTFLLFLSNNIYQKWVYRILSAFTIPNIAIINTFLHTWV